MSEGSGDKGLRAAAAAAIALVDDGAKVGLGTGHAAGLFIDLLGARVQDGLRVSAVATSDASAKRAEAHGIKIVPLDEDTELDLTVDGADEVTPDLDLLKGFGGALARERIVAAASRKQVIVVGPEKLVKALGERGRIPVEVLPFARGFAVRRLRALKLRPVVRMAEGGGPAFTDNGNLTLDCAPSSPLDPSAARTLEKAIHAIPGVVDTGLFLGTATEVLVGHPMGRVETLRRK